LLSIIVRAIGHDPGKTRTRRRWTAGVRSDSGAALIELAVVTPLLLLMALGIGDFGRVVYDSIVLSHAARAGAHYGAQSNATTADSAGIRQAALQEAQNIPTIGVTSLRICECPGTGEVSCTTATCGAYGVPQVFVQVTTTATFETLSRYPGIPASVPLSRTARVRRQ
jgi:Flp pilus assembly protein TadG